MNDSTEIKDLCIDERSNNYLKEIAMWGTFLAILGYIKCGVLLLFTIVFPLTATKIESHFAHDIPKVMITFGFFILAVIVYFPSNYLYLFAKYTKRALIQNDQDVMRHAFQSLKAYYRFFGILVIVIFCLYLIAIVTAIILF